MDLASIVKTQVQFARLGQSAQSGSASSASQLLAPANKRLSQQLESTSVQLSAYGQISSAFGSAKTAATSLADTAASKTASNSDVVKAAQTFVNTYNQATQAVSSAVSGADSKAGALASDVRAKMAGNDLAWSLTSGSGLADLKQAGITRDKNGTLTLDTKALEQSLQSASAETKSALTHLGQQVGASTGRELASGGNVGGSINALTNRSQSLTAQQTTLQQQATAVEGLLEQQSNVLNYATATSLASYQKLLSG